MKHLKDEKKLQLETLHMGKISYAILNTELLRGL